MKLRIQGNSLRIRIRQQELADLNSLGQVVEAVTIGVTPAERLEYALVTADTDSLSVSFVDQRITVHLPVGIVTEMVETDRVGIASEVTIAAHQMLAVRVEKDFKCLTPRDEDTDAFPHPEVEAGHQC